MRLASGSPARLGRRPTSDRDKRDRPTRHRRSSPDPVETVPLARPSEPPCTSGSLALM
jgi:hypothetical protein